MRKLSYTRAGMALAGLLALASVAGAGLKWYWRSPGINPHRDRSVESSNLNMGGMMKNQIQMVLVRAMAAPDTITTLIPVVGAGKKW
jgi:hypothetical protein